MKIYAFTLALFCTCTFIGCSGTLSQNRMDAASETSSQQPSLNTENPQSESQVDEPQTTSPDEMNTPCMKVSGPFCEVMISEDECDPKLVENHYKPGDTLFWVNYTQYDTTDCYYTEQEYNDNHNHKECAELQNEGRGCVIDDSPLCDVWLDADNCTVVYSRSACDEKLADLNMAPGDTVPGIWFPDRKKMECFYTKDERKNYLKKHHWKCENSNVFGSNICEVNPK